MTEKKDEFELKLTGIKKPSQVTVPEIIGLYGSPGSGKTWLAASASEVKELAPILIIDTEGSTTGTVADFDDESIDIYDLSEIEDDSEKLRAFVKLMKELTTKTHPYNTVVIDTFDVAQAWATKFYQAKHEDNGFKAWGEVKEWTVRTIRNLKAAKFLTIVNFHEKEDKTDTGMLVSKLVLDGSARDVVPGIFDIIGYTTRKADKEGKTTTTVQFSPNPRKATKNRFEDKIPARMEEPTIGKLYELITKKKNGGK